MARDYISGPGGYSVLKKMVAVAALVAGFSWAAPASAAVPDHGAGATVEAEVDVQTDVIVRDYDLRQEADVAALLSLILGLDVEADVEAEAAVDVSP